LTDGRRVFITGMGIISAMGRGVAETLAALERADTGIRPLTLFTCPFEEPLPVGEVRGVANRPNGPPRTHQLALAAAREALAGADRAPDMVILGGTTGGMFATEEYMKQGHRRPPYSQHHAVSSVAEMVARECGCRGGVMTVTTACSSGAVGIKLALEILRRGAARSILAGGADGICRLTYYGFNALQIVDRAGARPMDRDRRGMTVSEGAAMLLLTAADQPPDNALAEVGGGGLTCDAYHPAAPHPEGRGARDAMLAALADAGLSADDVDYVNLHGTGTVENDLSEARALTSVFGDRLPMLSSVKGSFGHSLAASGAIEAVIAALCIQKGFVPSNVGWRHQDETIGFSPLTEPRHQPVRTVLSNSLGFGGNNAALVFRSPAQDETGIKARLTRTLAVRAYGCMTGAGWTGATLERFFKGLSCQGTLSSDRLSEGLPPRAVRRMKRLARMTLGLAARTVGQVELTDPIGDVYFGTALGALSETHDFLDKLYASNEFYTSPIDFVGSVHNAPAGKVAMKEKVQGANVTMSGGDASFEQALTAAQYLSAESRQPLLVGGADEMHPIFSEVFDKSVPMGASAADGGGMLLLETAGNGTAFTLSPGYMATTEDVLASLQAAVAFHGGRQAVNDRIGALMVGIPAAWREGVAPHLDNFLRWLDFKGPVVDYRRYFGEFATVSAVAAVAAVALMENGAVPGPLAGGKDCPLTDRGILLIGLGTATSTMLVESS